MFEHRRERLMTCMQDAVAIFFAAPETIHVKNLADGTIKGPTEEVGRKLMSEETQKVLDEALTEREATVIRMRFGLGHDETHTLEVIGMVFDVTRERIRQIEAKALRKLRRSSASSGLRYFHSDGVLA